MLIINDGRDAYLYTANRNMVKHHVQDVRKNKVFHPLETDLYQKFARRGKCLTLRYPTLRDESFLHRHFAPSIL